MACRQSELYIYIHTPLYTSQKYVWGHTPLYTNQMYVWDTVSECIVKPFYCSSTYMRSSIHNIYICRKWNLNVFCVGNQNAIAIRMHRRQGIGMHLYVGNYDVLQAGKQIASVRRLSECIAGRKSECICSYESECIAGRELEYNVHIRCIWRKPEWS